MARCLSFLVRSHFNVFWPVTYFDYRFQPLLGCALGACSPYCFVLSVRRCIWTGTFLVGGFLGFIRHAGSLLRLCYVRGLSYWVSLVGCGLVWDFLCGGPIVFGVGSWGGHRRCGRRSPQPSFNPCPSWENRTMVVVAVQGALFDFFSAVTVSGTNSDSPSVTCDCRKFSEILRACDM